MRENKGCWRERERERERDEKMRENKGCWKSTGAIRRV